MIYFAYILFIAAFYFLITGIILLYRFPNFSAKIHASSLIDTVFTSLFLIGLCLVQHNIDKSLKILFILILLFIFNPVASHCLAKAHFKNKNINE